MQIYMKVYETANNKESFLLRGPVTKTPYKGWFELQSAQTGGRVEPNLSLGTSVGRAPASHSTDVTVTTEFIELMTFSLSPQGSREFTAQIDFMTEDGSKAAYSVVLNGTWMSNVSVSEGHVGKLLCSAALNAKSLTYTFYGSATTGSPSWTVRGP